MLKTASKEYKFEIIVFSALVLITFLMTYNLIGIFGIDTDTNDNNILNSIVDNWCGHFNIK